MESKGKRLVRTDLTFLYLNKACHQETVTLATVVDGLVGPHGRPHPVLPSPHPHNTCSLTHQAYSLGPYNLTDLEKMETKKV